MGGKWGDTDDDFESATDLQDKTVKAVAQYIQPITSMVSVVCGHTIGGHEDVKLDACPACHGKHIDDNGICMDCDYDTTREVSLRTRRFATTVTVTSMYVRCILKRATLLVHPVSLSGKCKQR